MPPTANERRRSPTHRARPAKASYAGHAHSDDPRWLLVERVAVSRSLGRSERLADFLRYVADCTVRNQHEQITEQQIGVRVFGRVEGYDSNNDNIVRNYARMLRKRLDDYFRLEGADEPLTLVIPRGGYVPVFLPREGSVPAQSSDSDAGGDIPSLTTPTETDLAALGSVAVAEGSVTDRISQQVDIPVRPALRRTQMALTVAALFATAAAALFGFFELWRERPLNPTRASSLLWSQLFVANRDTFVVPADGGLVMMQSFSREPVTLPEYINGSYRSPAGIDHDVQGLLKSPYAEDSAQLTRRVEKLAARRYTSIVDLDFVARLAQLPAVVPGHLVVRFARDLTIDDLRNSNAVLIGSSDSNPWVSLFESQLNFEFARGNEFGGSGTIVNTHPLPKEQPSYASVTGDPANSTYGVIAYVPNLDGTGHVLLVEGVNMAATQAAANLLMNPAAMQTLLKRALDSKGHLQCFEILLKTNSVAANAAGVEVLSERVHAAPTR